MFEDVSPVKKSAAFMAFMLMAALLILSKGLLPYYDYLRLLSDCNMESPATIYSEDEPLQDDIYYYGPTVEFSPDGFLPVHTKAVSTVKSRAGFRKGDPVTIAYDGSINSDVVILDDKTCVNNLILLGIAAGVIALIGIIDFVCHVATRDSVPKGETKKFDTTPDGLSFDEWQQLKKMEELRDAETEAPAGHSPADEKED